MKEKESMTNAGEILAEVYKEHFSDIYKFVYRRVGNKQVAEDITHDVFCAALNKREEFLEHPEPEKWLMVTAKNKMRELNRRMKRMDPRSAEEIPEPAMEEPDYEGIELELTALAIIDEDEWKLIKDYYLTGITIRELAERYGITENNMRVRLHRLRVKMKNGIER